MGFFNTHTVTVRRSNPTNGEILAKGKSVQMDPKNQDWQMENGPVMGIPVDVYDVETNGWTTPLVTRSDYLIDEKTGEAYSVRSTVFQGQRSLQFQVTRYSGGTP